MQNVSVISTNRVFTDINNNGACLDNLVSSHTLVPSLYFLVANSKVLRHWRCTEKSRLEIYGRFSRVRMRRALYGSH